MAENGSRPWVMWLAGTIVTMLTIALTTIGNAVITNDKESRSRDDKIEDCLNLAVSNQQLTNQKILIALNEIQVDLRYIKRNGR